MNREGWMIDTPPADYILNGADALAEIAANAAKFGIESNTFCDIVSLRSRFCAALWAPLLRLACSDFHLR